MILNRGDLFSLVKFQLSRGPKSDLLQVRESKKKFDITQCDFSTRRLNQLY